MAAILNGNELLLTGDVGDFGYSAEHFTHAHVVEALAKVDDGRTLTVVLNSGGGIATEGAAIHAALAKRRGRTDVTVEGIAASAASLIAMAGGTVSMALGSSMMIHDPSGFTIGTADDHSSTTDALNALGDAYASVYAAKSGKSVAECRRIMKAETWYTAEQAVAAGFADQVLGRNGKPVASWDYAAFDYRVYAHAPKSLKALVTACAWMRPTMQETPALRVDIVEMARKRQEAATASTVANMQKLLGQKPTKPADASLRVDIVGDARALQSAKDEATASAVANMRKLLARR